MTILIFIVVLAVLVFVHELGHFVMARRAGAKVEEFGIGFPPRLFSWKRGETVYSVNAIPLGGFVKIFGEDEAEVKAPRSFGSLSIGKRAGVLVAGVAMNFALAWVLLSFIAVLGQPTIVTPENENIARDVGIRILQVTPESPAAEAGIRPGDTVRAVANGSAQAITEIEEFQEFVNIHRGSEISILLDRNGTEQAISVTPREDVPANEGAIGVAIGKVGTVPVPFWQAPWHGLKLTAGLSFAIVGFIGQLIASAFTGGGGELVSSLAGPVGIASLTGEAARLGFVYLMQFTAVLSVNLAVLNILPFPALDGGRLVFLLIEKVKKKPVPKSIEHAVNMTGFMLLILLVLWITWQDITRFVL